MGALRNASRRDAGSGSEPTVILPVLFMFALNDAVELLFHRFEVEIAFSTLKFKDKMTQGFRFFLSEYFYKLVQRLAFRC